MYYDCLGSMCLSNKQTNTRYCLFDRLEKFCLFVWSEVVKRTKHSVQVLFGDHPGRLLSSFPQPAGCRYLGAKSTKLSKPKDCLNREITTAEPQCKIQHLLLSAAERYNRQHNLHYQNGPGKKMRSNPERRGDRLCIQDNNENHRRRSRP